ncbi:MAG: phage tail tape measure protein [Candidatus Pacebacteria bacterium]|nr:phage tail tape measure protein [Candidatus Paceibacterota bacterium]PIR60881.1 MAG: hypothetical protein COU67_00285 [Candidatus Pacebacteria bacterium CG10_big_fil_rev_8_21_14_0_10_44_54]
MLKRILTTAVLFSMVFLPNVIYAQQGESASLDYAQFSTEEFAAYKEATENCDSPSLECLTKNTTRFVAMEWIHDILGQPTKDQATSEVSANSPTEMLVNSNTGLMGGMTKLIAGMYSYPPARTSRFVADVAQSAGVTPAYAQGLGFAALDPVLDLWKKFRNLAYFFFIIMFLVIGFMIMFRSKVGGQAAITAQQAIPSILISLILVTFSYAISGFLIDLMYLSMYLIVGLFGELTTDSGASSSLISMNIFQLGGQLLKESAGNLGQTTDIVNQVIVGLIGTSNAVTGLVSIISGLTLSLVLAVAIVIALFRLFFELLKSYASIVVGVVTAPIYLMMGAIPGKNAFAGWIKSMIGNLAAFPTVLLVVVLFYEFTQAGSAGSSVRSGGFLPPFLIGGGQSSVASALLGFALLLALPEVVKKIKEALGAKAGLGEQIAGWAGGRMKDAWSGKYGAKSIMREGAKLPVRGVGAYYGAKLGSNFAEKAGLTGWKRNLATIAGSGVGFQAAPSVPGFAINTLKSTGNQVRDAYIKEQLEDVKTAIDKTIRRKDADAYRDAAVKSQDNIKHPESSQAKQGDGISSKQRSTFS